MHFGARDLIYTYDVYQEIIDKIKFFHPNISQKELKKVKDSLWLVLDGILGHNGERSESEFVPNVGKTQEDFEEELVKCHTQKGFDKTIVPATPEACLMRIADKISYTAFDMVDGLKEGFITDLNQEYREELGKLGITQEEINQYLKAKDYDSLGKRIRDIFTKDLTKNSTKKRIAMSEEIGKVMHNLRRINNRQIVDYVLMKEDFPIYIGAVNTLIDTYRDIILEGEMEGKYDDTPYLPFVNYISNMSKKDYKFTQKLVERSIEQSDLKENQVNKKEKMAIAMGAQYLATLSDREFSELIENTGLATPEQVQRLHRKYKDIDLKQESALDSNWMQISKEQDKDLGEEK